MSDIVFSHVWVHQCVYMHESLLTNTFDSGSCVKVYPPTTLYSLCVRISTFLWTRAKMWDLSEPCTFASHLRCSTSAAAGKEANMYNARGRLQLMHLSCSQGGAKTLSELSSPCIPHLARQHVAPCLLPWFSISTKRVSFFALSSERRECEVKVVRCSTGSAQVVQASALS